MQRKRAIQFQRFGGIDGKRTAQPGIRRIGVRDQRVQAIGSAALDDEHETALGLGACECDAGRGKQCRCAGNEASSVEHVLPSQEFRRCQ
jgi:hypothetical protein